jgi:serine phosphatase RsbU (regulator of sigma subunit)/tetratricopeptide (TPR) repeat protein/putative methionine-R-sulfoxide reductase with GAF domain
LDSHRTEPSKGKELAKEALDLSEKLNYSEGWARGYYALGASSIWLSEYDNAITYSLKALGLLQQEGLAMDTVNVLYNISITYYLLDDLDNAMKYSQRCYELSDKINFNHGKAMGINAKACILYTDNRNDEAVELIEEGLVYAEDSDDIEIKAKLMDGLGQAYFNLGEYDKSLKYKSECLKIVRSLKSMGTVAFALDGIGMIHLKQENPKEALEHFEEALIIRQEIGFVAGEAQSYLHLGLLNKELSKFKDAINFYEAALELGTLINSLKVQYKAYHHLAEIYEEKNDLKQFSVHYKKYHECKEEFLKQHIQKKYQTRELISQMEQVDSERVLLAKKNDELKKYSNDIRVLSEIGKELTSTLNFDEILEKVYNQVNSVMDASVFLIAMYTEETTELSFELCVEKDVRMPDVTIKVEENDGRLATYVIKNQKEVVINDYHREISKLKGVNAGVLAGEMPESIIYMPIMANDKLLGLISVQSFEKYAYSDYDIDLIRSLSVYAAIALKNASSYRTIEDQVVERTKEIQQAKQKVEKAHANAELIGELGQKLISSLNLDDVMVEVYEKMNKLMDAGYFGLSVFNAEKGVLHCKYSIEKGKWNEPIDFTLEDSSNLSVWAVNNRKDVFINDIEKDVEPILGYNIEAKLIRGDMPECCIFIPLINNNEVLGVITVQSFQKNAYSDYQYSLLKSIASYFIIALENAKTYESIQRIVDSRTKEVTEQKEIIEEKNKRITDSIKYAKRIQEAILPTQKSVEKYERTSFVLYKPKDIVSGDFYWMEEADDKIIFAVVDCTGHGVPGAFMSIIGYNGLYQIVKEKKITKPSEILKQLNDLVLNVLRQTDENDSISDGMDISICCLNKRDQTLEFAGAFNPLYHIRNGELTQFKGDKYSVGSAKRSKIKEFTNHLIKLEPKDRIYIFSDGYADQFGGEFNKKFKYHNFRKVLLDIYKKPMNDQRNELERIIEDWKGEEDQVDDICVIGVKF